MAEQKAIVMSESDNVATVVDEIEPGTDVRVARAGMELIVNVADRIPFGHKFAIREIKKGEPIVKYAEPIGTATADIAAGRHVHIHNVESGRGRGDR